jgi:tRNA dimethylallyltransferase
VVSADSRQFYKELSIGTAKPTKEEQKGIKHYFIDSHSITDEVSAARFANEAESLLQELFKSHDTIVLTGGSGMFIDALCFGIDDIQTDTAIRDELIAYVDKNGTKELLKELEDKDPVYFQKVDKANPVRIIRAIQVIRSTGKPYSELRTGEKRTHNFTIRRFIIEHPRDQLYDRINRRVDIMISEGLIEEVRSVKEFKELNALRTVGYKELIDYLEGKTDLDKTLELIKQHTRNYAKRQLTWFQRYKDAAIIPYSSNDQMLKEIIDDLNDLY